MSQIQVSGLTFGYEGSYDNVFENVSFSIDTDWKLGLIGRNGKGKTTFLNLLLGKYPFEGSINTSIIFDYFPYVVAEAAQKEDTVQVLQSIHPDYEFWKVCRELDLLHTDPEILYRPYETLSHGEQTKVMLALLFSEDNHFLLIDEPTNHLDMVTREMVSSYLRGKKGFILVSHDRRVLDACVDHVLVLERSQIEIEQGNFTSWYENKQKRDAFEKSENEKLKQEVKKLKESARRSGMWADKVEGKKIGYNPTAETDHSIDTRAYLGEKSRRMQQRRKNLERRQQTAISEKSKLLKNLEKPVDLKLTPLEHHKETYLLANHFSVSYEEKEVVRDFSMELKRGDRIFLQGPNGCGKSSILKAVLASEQAELPSAGQRDAIPDSARYGGVLKVAAGLRISYINQDTSFLHGSLDDYIEKSGVDQSLFKAVLRQLDFERVQFEKSMDAYSAGQKKKVLIAGSLLTPAHLYIWDEPLNYIDVFSRMQIENLILQYQPTMLLVEHDSSFAARCATGTVLL